MIVAATMITTTADTIAVVNQKTQKGATMLLFVGFLNFFIFIIYVITAINLTDGWCKCSTCFDRSSSKNKGKVNISLWLDNYSEIDYFFIFSKYLLQAF